MPGYLRVLAERRRQTHCKYCRAVIEWATKLSTMGPQGRNIAKVIPLNANALVLNYERTEGGLKVEVFDADRANHMVTCTRKPARRSRLFRGRA